MLYYLALMNCSRLRNKILKKIGPNLWSFVEQTHIGPWVISTPYQSSFKIWRENVPEKCYSNCSIFVDMISNLQKCLPHYTNYDPQIYVRSAIKLCKNVHDLKPLKSIIITSGLVHYKHVISKFIGQCFDLGTPQLALSTFNFTKNRSLLLQNFIIKRLCKLGLFQDVISVYKTCRISGCLSGDYTFPYVIKACAVLCDVKLGREIHCVVLRTGYDRNVVVQTALVDFYAKIGRMDVARKVFDGMPEWDVVSWNALISGFCLNGLDYMALDVLYEFWMKGVKANVGTLANVVPICTRLGLVNLGRSLHGYAVKCGFDQDELLIPALISMYSSNGDLHVAERLFDLSPVQNVVIWNSMMNAYAQNQKPEEAFQMFLTMPQADLQQNTVTFISVIPCCEKMDRLPLCECLHGYVMKYGLDNQVSVATALISTYAKLGDTVSATSLFDQMPNKNLLTWNSIISGYVYQGLLYTSLQAVHDMELAGFRADSISIVNVLSACSELQALLLGKSAHAISIRTGLDLSLTVMNSLLAFYSNCHLLHGSFKIFFRMPERNSVSWNTMISSCVSNGEAQKAENLLREMQQGVELDVFSLLSILPAYNECCHLSHGHVLHAYALKFGFISDITLANAFINMYGNCGNLSAASLLFSTMMVRCVVSWNSLITGFRCHNLHKEVTSLFKEMIKEDQKPNYITLLNVTPGCCTLLQIRSVHAYAIRTGALQTVLVTSLISMYSRFRDVVSCLSLFATGDRLDLSLWNAMLSALLEAREPDEALTLFHELLETELSVDYVTVLAVVSACGQLNSISLTNSVLAFVIRCGFSNETIICNALIDLYAKSGDILMAKDVFDGLIDKNAVSWSVMITGFGLHGDGNAAVTLLSQMENSGTAPDPVTYLNVLSACSHAGLAEQSKIVISYMVTNGIHPTNEHYACLVDSLGRTGQLDEACQITKRLSGGPSVSILESLLGACRVYGNIELGCKVGELLLERDPNNSTSYVTLYNIYACAGRWQDANRIRTVMEQKHLRKVPAFSMLEGQT